jgi:hypothetical protein
MGILNDVLPIILKNKMPFIGFRQNACFDVLVKYFSGSALGQANAGSTSGQDRGARVWIACDRVRITAISLNPEIAAGGASWL